MPTAEMSTRDASIFIVDVVVFVCTDFLKMHRMVSFMYGLSYQYRYPKRDLVLVALRLEIVLSLRGSGVRFPSLVRVLGLDQIFLVSHHHRNWSSQLLNSISLSAK